MHVYYVSLTHSYVIMCFSFVCYCDVDWVHVCRFYFVVRSCRDLYQNCPNHSKSKLAKSIVQVIQQQQPPGRFIKSSTPNNIDDVWKQITYKQAVSKTMGALRENRWNVDNSIAEPLNDTLNHMSVWRDIKLASESFARLTNPSLHSDKSYDQQEGQHQLNRQQEEQQKAGMYPVTQLLLSPKNKQQRPQLSNDLVGSSLPLYTNSIREQITLHSHDVVLGRGKFYHSGNKWYQKLIGKYRAIPEHDKAAIAKVLVKAVHERLPHGRFLKLALLPTKHWTLVSNEEAIEKTFQALCNLSQQVSSIQCTKRITRDDDEYDGGCC